MNQLDSRNFASVNAAGGSNLYDIMVWHPHSAAPWRNECKSAEQSGPWICGVNCAEFLFGNSSASVLVFWNPQNGQPFSIASPFPAGTAEISLFGSRRKVGGAAYSVTMSDSPSYLVFDGIAPVQVVPLITQPYITGRAKGIFSGVTR
jgi:hypothetical protein